MSGHSRVLLLDAGNSGVKWAVCMDGGLQEHGVHTYDRSRDDYGLGLALRAVNAPVDKILAASVATAKVGEALVTAVAHLGVAIEFASVRSSVAALQVSYPQPHRLGVDRWLAMLGARDLHAGPICVADCGTALTLDAVTDDGHHRGGAIVPGFVLMSTTLSRDTAQIGEQGGGRTKTLFGNSTAAAVNAGCTLALAGAVDRFVTEFALQTQSPPLLFVTGGDRARLLEYLHCDAVEVPDLVLLGLKYQYLDIL